MFPAPDPRRAAVVVACARSLVATPMSEPQERFLALVGPRVYGVDAVPLPTPVGLADLSADERLCAVRLAMVAEALGDRPEQAGPWRAEAARHGVVDASIDVHERWLDGTLSPSGFDAIVYDARPGGGRLERLRAHPALSRVLAHDVPDGALLSRVDDPVVAEAFSVIETAPDGSLGALFRAWYARDGLGLPGRAGGIPLLVALHDWVHLLFGYSTRRVDEICVGTVIAGACRDPRAYQMFLFAFYAFECGVAPIAIARPRTLEEDNTRRVEWRSVSKPLLMERWLDAAHRALACTVDPYLGIDHLLLAHEDIEVLRARFGVPPVGVVA